MTDSCLGDIAYHLAHDYPGGVPALAVRMGKNATVLMHKLNPNNTTHHLTAHELDALDDFTGGLRVAEYFAHKHDCYLVRMAAPEGLDESALMDAFFDVTREWGEFCAEFQADYADGEITQEEYQRLKARRLELCQRMVALTDRIFLMVEGGDDG